ncbi:DNA glycosylase [Xylaria venustula]|nr:DNA glycosylase [Xylaria venustula]
MARGTRNSKTDAVDGSTNRLRSARGATLGINGISDEHAKGNGNDENENENERDERKTTAKRGRRADSVSVSAPDLRRSKRIKSDDAPKENGQVKREKRDGKAKKRIKTEDDDEATAALSPLPPTSSPLPVKAETEDSKVTPKKSTPSKPKPKATEADLQAKKLKSYTQFAAARQSPYPDFPHPTAAECKLAHQVLTSLHGARVRPEAVKAPSSRAGCGDSASVLDALVRTILSQNTSDKNSSRAKLSMDRAYGGSDAWEKIVTGGQEKLAKTIESGGLAVVKSKVILSILEQTKTRYGVYSLDHLFAASDEDAMKEMLSFKGVGPKTASCVLLFCLRRASFAVDTHVHRITGLLGWRPPAATRDQTHAHLDARIPDEDKYGLHVLLVRHGKECEECKAGGKNLGRCALRKAFRKGKIEGRAGSEVKEEEIKAEEEEGEEGEKIEEQERIKAEEEDV